MCFRAEGHVVMLVGSVAFRGVFVDVDDCESEVAVLG